MKNIKFIVLGAIAAGFVLTGCGQKDPTLNLAPKECVVSGLEAPLWVCGNLDDLNAGDKLYSTGSAKLSELGREFSRKQALASARANLADAINADVISQVQEEAKERQIDDNVAVERMSEQAVKQLSNETLQNTAQASSWEDTVGKELYVLVSIPKSSIKVKVKELRP